MADRTSVCKKVYVNKDNTESRSAGPDVVAQEFRFTNGNTHSIKFADFPAEIRACAGLHGLSQTLGDKFAGSKGDADAAESDFESKVEQLMAGNWIVGGVGVPRISIVLEAIIRCKEAEGDKMDEKRIAAAREALKDPKILKSAGDDAPIARMRKVIELERAQARLDKMPKPADDAKVGVKF